MRRDAGTVVFIAFELVDDPSDNLLQSIRA